MSDEPQSQENNYLKYGDKIVLYVETVQGYIQSQGFSNPNLFVQKTNFKSDIFTRNYRDFVFLVCPKLNYDARKDYSQAQRIFQKSGPGSEDHAPAKQGTKGASSKDVKGKGSANAQTKKSSQGVEEQALKKKMQQLQKKLVEEEEMNSKILERRMGEIVTYGQEIQLLHCDSQTFISAKKMCAEIDKSCNKVELQDHGSSSIYFKVMPRYKYRQEGEKILYNDQVVLQNPKLGLYMHITEQVLHIHKPKEIPPVRDATNQNITPNESDRRTPPHLYCPMYELNTSTKLSRFQIQPFANFDQQDPQTIRGGSVIKIQHSELGGFLASDEKDFTNDGLSEVFLWTFKGKALDVENFNTSSLFEIEIANQEKEKGQYCVESQEEERNDRDEVITEEGMLFRLRHLNTGRLVGAQEIVFKGNKIMTLGLMKHLELRKNERDPNVSYTNRNKFVEYELADQEEKDAAEENTLFRIISTNSEEDKTLFNNVCVKIQHVGTGMFLSIMKKEFYKMGQDNMVKNSEESQQIPNSKSRRNSYDDDENNGGEMMLGNQLYQPMDDQDINQAMRNVVELKQEAGHNDAFFISLEEEDSLRDILYVHSALGNLKACIPYLCDKEKDIPKDVFLQLERILQYMIRFVKGKEEQNDNKFEQRHEVANGPQVQFNQGSAEDLTTLRKRVFKRQKIVRELYLIELIVQILYYPFATETYDLDLIKQEDTITKICSYAYQLLKYAVGGYEINEMYASQWINLFFMQAMRTQTYNDIQAQTTVNELVSDNRKLLENMINSSIINQFIQLCKSQERNKRLIKLLTALCTCNGEPIVHNQNDVVKTLLAVEENKNALMMPIRGKGQIVEVYYIDTFLPISKLKDMSKKNDNGRIYKYFLSIIELAADLAQGRNMKAVSRLQPILEAESCQAIIYNSELPHNLRSYFLELFLNMYMDREPLEPLQIPALTIVQSEIPDIKNLIQKNEKGYQIQQATCEIPSSLIQFKKFVLTFLKNEKGVQSVFEKQKNQFIYWIVKALHFMLSHGFYKNQHELNDLSLPLILLLDGSNDTYYDPHDPTQSEETAAFERYKFSKANEIILKSKKLQCDCLIFISQMELDGRAELFLSKLKFDFEQSMMKKTEAKAKVSKAVIGKLFGGSALKRQQSNMGEKRPTGDLERKNTKDMEIDGVSLIERLRKVIQLGDQKDIEALFEKTTNQEFLNGVANLRGFEEEIEEIYICMLFDLLLYKYPELNQTAFELLVRYFTRRRTLLESLNKLQILENKHSIDVLNKVKVYQAELRIFEKDLGDWIEKEERQPITNKNRCKEIFRHLTHYCVNNNGVIDHSTRKSKKQLAGWLMKQSQSTALNHLISNSTIMKETAESDQDQEDRDLEEKEEFIMFLEYKNPENKENQRIMRNFQIQDFAIKFIAHRIEASATTNIEYIELIKQCYRYLIRFCKDNLTNQSTLRDNLDIFMKDLDKFTLSPMLIYEIFKNNKRLLNLNVSKILKHIVLVSEEADINSSLKSTLFKLLQVFCRCKEKLVRQNQQDIIIFMTNNVARSSILYLFSAEGFPDVQNLLNQCKDIEICENQLNGQLVAGATMVMTNPVFNIINCIELLSVCCEGKSDIAELKCQTDVLPLENVCKIMDCCEYFWPLKTTLANYVTQCFIDSSNKNVLSQDDEVGIRSLWKIAEIMANDLVNIVENFESEDEVLVKFPNSDLQSLKTLSLKFLGQGAVPFFKALLRKRGLDLEAYEKLLNGVAQFVARLYYLTNDHMDVKRSCLEFLRYVHESAKFSRYIDSIEHPFKGMAEHNTIMDYDEEQKKQHPDDEEISRSSSLSSKIMKLQNNDKIIEQIELEFEELVHWVTHIEKKIKQVTKSQNKQGQDYNAESFKNLTFQSVVCAILNLIDSKTLSKDLHISGLRLIRKIVEVENKEKTTPAADWDTEDWVEYKSMIQIKQDALVEVGTISFLCKHLSEVDDDDIVEHTILACIAMLLGGNPKSQQAFLDFMADNDPHNKVMTKIHRTLVRQFEYVKNYLSEKNSKLVMMAKIQDRNLRKQKTLENKIKNVAAGGFLNIGLHKENNESQMNETQENLMTVDDSFSGPKTDGEKGNENQDTYMDESSQINQTKQQSMNKMMRILRFLQLLTENHFTPMQDFLREQNSSSGQTNSKTIDMVSQIATILGNYENQYVNKYSCHLGYQMIETLTEFIQGPCKENQRALVNAKVIDNCRDLINQGTQSEREMREKGFIGEEEKLLDGLKMKAVRLLLSIIEGPIDQEIIRNITVSLDDFVVIFERLKKVYQTFITGELGLSENSSLSTIMGELKKESFDGDVQEGFDIFILVNSLADCYPEAKRRVEKFEETEYYQFFKENTGQIEIQIAPEQLQRVYFPLKPVCRYLSDLSRKALMLNVDRTSPQQKILGLLKAVPDLIDEMEHVEVLSRQTIQITPDRLNFLRDCSTLLAVGISLAMLIYYKYDVITYPDGSIDIGPTIDEIPDFAIEIMGFIQLGTAAALLIGWIINKASLIIKAGWRSYTEENKIKYQAALAKMKANEVGSFGIKKAAEMSLLDARMILLTQGPEAQEFQDEGKLNLGHIILRMEYLWICSSFVIGAGQFRFFIIYLTLSFLGLYISPIFYSFQLMDIINRFATLKNVIQAITLNKDQLLLTAMLALIVVYIYSVLSYAFFFDMFWNPDINLDAWIGENGDRICQNLFHCYISTINYGVRAGGGIGEAIPALSFLNTQKETWYLRTIYDLSFFLIVNIMFLNIIFGIIIDTFAELREIKGFIDMDMKNTCFICSIDSQTFDRDTENGFTYHIKNEHNLWQYVFFIIHLKTKDKTDYNGTESFIEQKLDEEDVSWFPLHTSICLESSKYIISDSKDNKPAGPAVQAEAADGKAQEK